MAHAKRTIDQQQHRGTGPFDSSTLSNIYKTGGADPNGNQGTIRHLYLQMLAIATSRYDPSTQGGALVTVFHGRHSLDLNITMLHLSQACNARAVAVVAEFLRRQNLVHNANANAVTYSTCKMCYSRGKDDNPSAQTKPAVRSRILGRWSKLTCEVCYSLGKDDNPSAQTEPAVRSRILGGWSKLDMQSVLFPR